VFFNVGVGSDYKNTAGSWVATREFSSTGSVDLISTLSATWQITGVQLEAGSVATPFERRPYGTELVLCQRYYYRNAAPSGSHYGSGFNDSSSNAFITVPFPTTMRAAPSALEQSGTAGHYAIQRSGDFPTCTSVPTFSSANTQVAMVQFVSSSNLTAGQGSIGRSANSSGFLAWSAEL
jgi:hypothetical protein